MQVLLAGRYSFCVSPFMAIFPGGPELASARMSAKDDGSGGDS